MTPLNLQPTTSYPKTLEEVTAYKLQIKKEIDNQQLVVTHALKSLMPEKKITPFSFFTSGLTRGVPMVDGILFGLKIIRFVRKYLYKNRL